MRIWSKVDLGTLKKQDLFLTNSRLEAVNDFTADFNYLIQELVPEEEEKVTELIQTLNG